MTKLCIIRPEREIQRAHDILEAVFLGEVDLPLSHDSRLALNITLSTLCWVLGHDHNSTFADNLRGLEQAIAALGYVLKDRTQ